MRRGGGLRALRGLRERDGRGRVDGAEGWEGGRGVSDGERRRFRMGDESGYNMYKYMAYPIYLYTKATA